MTALALPQIDWPKWAASQRSSHWTEGMYAIRRSDNPYPPNTWAHEQWNRGYDECPIAGG